MNKLKFQNKVNSIFFFFFLKPDTVFGKVTANVYCRMIQNVINENIYEQNITFGCSSLEMLETENF